MIRREMCDCMNRIKQYYTGFDVNTERVTAWQEILYFVKLEDFNKAINSYIRNEVYPPTIAGLLEYWKGNNYDKSADRPGD